VSWLWAVRKLEPLIPAHVTLPNLCHALAHVYIVHVPLLLFGQPRVEIIKRTHHDWPTIRAGYLCLVCK